MRRCVIAGILCVLVTAMPVGASPMPADKSDNVTRVANFEFGWTPELAFQGRYAYALVSKAPKSEIFIIDRKKLKVISSFKCSVGTMGTEIESVKRGWVAFNTYDGPHGPCEGQQGVLFLNVKDPRNPKLGGVVREALVHTMTAYPGKPYIYVSPNGCCGDFAGGVEQLIDARDPNNPKMTEFLAAGLGCHDVAFGITEDRKFAGCAAGAETQLWDVSDPLRPTSISRMPTPHVFFNHSAGFTDDVRLMVVGDEAHGVNSCTGTPTGSLWFYDISVPEVPVLRGFYNIPRGSVVSSFWATEASWCTAHMYDFKPDTRLLATAWYQGGMNVIDVSDPTTPKEVAHYRADDFSPWAAYWVDGLIWTSDTVDDDGGGVEVFEVSGLND